MSNAGGRYGALPIVQRELADGTVVRFRARRFVPAPDAVPSRPAPPTEARRADLIAAQTLRDPLAWWRLCDATGLMSAAELEEPGRSFRVPDVRPDRAP